MIVILIKPSDYTARLFLDVQKTVLRDSFLLWVVLKARVLFLFLNKSYQIKQGRVC